MTRRQLIFARIILGLYLVALAVLCLANFHTPPDVKKTIFGIPTDKVVHFCMFFPMPVLAFFAFDKYTGKVWLSLLFTTVTFLVGIGIAMLTEWAQGLVPYRSCQRSDVVADVIALAVASVLVAILDISKMKKKPQ